MSSVAEMWPARTDTNGITWYRPAAQPGVAFSQWGWTPDPTQAHPSYREQDDL